MTQTLPVGHAELQLHPFCKLFPPMSAAEQQSLGDSLQANGQRHPILLHRGMVLDGRHRYQQLLRLGMSVRADVFTGDDRQALQLVLDENLHRRHLTESQRGLIAARIAELRLGDNQHSRPAPIGAPGFAFDAPKPEPQKRTTWPAGHTVTMKREYPADGDPLSVGTCQCGAVFRYSMGQHVAQDAAIEGHWAQFELTCAPIDSRGEAVPLEQSPEPPAPAAVLSQTEAAAAMNVGRRTVQRGAEVINKGAPELQAAVESGHVKLGAAAEIAQLPIERQREIIASADPKVVKDVAKEQRAEKVKASRERKLDKMRRPTAAPLITGKRYGVIYIDVPRKFQTWSDETGAEKAPGYPTQTFDYLANLPIRDLAAEDCALFMWSWASSLLDEIDLMAEWGFASTRRRGHQDGRLLRTDAGKILKPVGEGRYRSHMIWGKRASTGNWHRGTGYWFIDCHELLLVGARGKVPAPLMGTQGMSIFDSVVGKHSEKPDQIRVLIDRYFPDVPKIELFARPLDPTRWPSWTFWGDEFKPIEPAIDEDDGGDGDEITDEFMHDLSEEIAADRDAPEQSFDPAEMDNEAAEAAAEAAADARREEAA
jgi:N6-adenosine-specific RNA methylase IME4